MIGAYSLTCGYPTARGRTAHDAKTTRHTTKAPQAFRRNLIAPPHQKYSIFWSIYYYTHYLNSQDVLLSKKRRGGATGVARPIASGRNPSTSVEAAGPVVRPHSPSDAIAPLLRLPFPVVPPEQGSRDKRHADDHQRMRILVCAECRTKDQAVLHRTLPFRPDHLRTRYATKYAPGRIKINLSSCATASYSSTPRSSYGLQ